MRLLSHGSPITVTELAEAAGIDAADLANAPAGEDIEYDDERRIVGWGLTLCHCGNLDPCPAGLGRLWSACHLLQSRSGFSRPQRPPTIGEPNIPAGRCCQSPMHTRN